MRRTVTLATTLLAGWTLIAAAQQPSRAADGARARARRQHHAGVRGLVRERRRQLQPADRLLQPQFKEALDIPVGPNNRIEPGDPDQGQPTFFEIGRQWGVFVIKVPKDFGDQDDHLDDRRRTARRSRFRSR